MSDLERRYANVKQRIQMACNTINRPVENVKLLAVSKTKPLDQITAIADLGQIAFGENYVQEAVEKIAKRPDLEWHFIGPIQSNKTKLIAENFAWVHSVDRLKIAQRLSRQRPQNLPPLQILLEINIDQESTKAGLLSHQAAEVCQTVLELPNVKLRGLMAIPQATTDPQKQRAAFAQMRQLLAQLQSQFPEAQLDTLSMGMSGDLEAAIAEGATYVRIGTDIFGAREPRKP